MPIHSRRFLMEQLQLLLDELKDSREISYDFVRTHLASINEHARDLLRVLPRGDDASFLPGVALIRKTVG